MALIEDWISSLQQFLGKEELLVSSVRVGVFYTAVQISSGHVGVAFTPRDLSDAFAAPRRQPQVLPLAAWLAGRAGRLPIMPVRKAYCGVLWEWLRSMRSPRWPWPVTACRRASFVPVSMPWKRQRLGAMTA